MAEAASPPALARVFGADEIATRVGEMAARIDAVYGEEPMVAICVLNGAFMFFSDLVRRIANPRLELDFVRLSSYGMNSVSSKHIVMIKDIELDVRGKHVIIVEDIVDSGHTMRFLLDQLGCRKPKSLAVAALVDKRERREADVDVAFSGFCLPEGFIVGYGMDYAGRYRNLPDIRELVNPSAHDAQL